MAFSTFPNNPFPPSSAQFDEGKNEFIQAEIDAIKDGTRIDSFADVESALATKTNLSNIAPAFDATSGVYAVGDKIIYEDVLYEFISAHTTAGEWDESEVQPVKISELIDSLKSGLTTLVKTATEIITANPSGWIIFPQGRIILDARLASESYDTFALSYDTTVGGYLSRFHMSQNTTTPQYEMFVQGTDYSVSYHYI